MTIESRINKYLNERTPGNYKKWDIRGMGDAELKQTLPPNVYDVVKKSSKIVKTEPPMVMLLNDIHIYYDISRIGGGKFDEKSFKSLFKIGLKKIKSPDDTSWVGGYVDFIFKE